MSDDRTLYDEDILLWSEQQAATIRALGRRHDLPNAFDVENVAEEIESVGRSELAAVKSLIRLVFVNVMKLAVDSESDAVRHWRGELLAFHSDLTDRFAPSMRQRIDIDALWAGARQQIGLTYEGIPQQDRVAALPGRSPFALDDLLGERIDSLALVARLHGAGPT